MLPKTCQYCYHAAEATAANRTILICSRKQGSQAKFFVVAPNGTCGNFRHKNFGRQKPPLPSSSPIRYIPLTQGRFATVDPDDYDWLSRYKWHCRKAKNSFYAFRRRRDKMVSMHREIINAPEGLLVDHIDGDGLNNRRSNPRLCTYAQNACNRRPNRNSSSKYKGVSFHKREKKWDAQITWNRKTRYIGSFFDEVEAARAYDRKAEELFGDFAYLNFGNGRVS